MSSFNFKSSGKKITDRSLSSDRVTKKTRDIGIKTPLTQFQGRQIWDMHDDPRAQVKDNMRHILLTNRGERLGLYNFGADLSSLLFDFTSFESIEGEVVTRVQDAVEAYMPGVVIDEISAVELDRNEKNEINKKGMVKIRLRVKYSVPQARVNDQAIEVTLQNAG